MLITGANGFAGRHLIAHLLDTHGSDMTIVAAMRPDEIQSADDGPPEVGWSPARAGDVEIVALDVTAAEQSVAVVQGARPDAIVHLAARSSGADADRDAIVRVNVEGTRNVLEAAATLSPFPRTLVVSSGYVYGNTSPERPAREEDPIGPLWRYGPYTDSKIVMESVARSYRAFAIIARPFSHTGPGQPAGFAIPGFARQLARIEAGIDPPVLHVGNLSARRDLLDVRDVVRAYAALIAEGEAGTVYNVATGRPVTIGEALDQLRAMCMAPVAVEEDPARMRPSDIACSSGDPLCLWAALNWSPRIPLDNTLGDTLDYWRSQMPRYNPT